MTQYSWCWECIGVGDGDARTVNDIIAQNMFLGNLNPDTAGVVDWTDANAIPGITNPPTGGLAPTNPSGDTVRIATGVGLVQGWIYVNDANVDFDVSGGNANATDIIVLQRGDPASVGTVRLAHKRGPGGGTATVTQSVTTWEVKIAEVTLDGSGDFSSLSDVREYVETPLKVNTASLVDDAVTTAKIADTAVTNAKLATDAVTNAKVATDAIDTNELVDDSVDDTKAGNRVAQFYRRQGGDATQWDTEGTTAYTPTAVRVQVGSASIGVGGGTVTFPVAFSATPIVLVQINDVVPVIPVINGVTASQFDCDTYDHDGTSFGSTTGIRWIAIGPE